MNVTADLIFPTAIDLVGLDRDLRSAESMVGDFADSASDRLTSITSPRISLDMGGSSGTAGDAAGAAGASAGQLALAFGSLAGKVRSALGDAVAPLGAFAADFSAKFDSVGGVLRKLSIRIDSFMRFEPYLKRVDSFRGAFVGSFGLALEGAGKSVADFELDDSKLLNQYRRIPGRARKAAGPIADVLKGPKKKILLDANAIGNSIQDVLKASDGAGSRGPFFSLDRGLDGITKKAAGAALDFKRMNGEMKAWASGRNAGKAPPPGKKGAAKGAPGSSMLSDLGGRARDLAGGIRAGIGKSPFLSGLAAEARQVGADLKKGIGNVGKLTQMLAIGADAVVQVAVDFQKLGNTISTFGSVARATLGGFNAGLNRIATKAIPQSVGGMKVLRQATGLATTAARGLGYALTAGLGPVGLILQAGSAFTSFFAGGIRGSSDLAETLSKTDVVLGSASGDVKKFADEMATRFGLAKGVTLDTAASMGGLGRSLGRLKGPQLAGFSKQFTMLAADLSSFSNIDVDAAAEALRTGLAGNQSDVLKELGVVMTENTVKAYAYAHGIAMTGEELNEQQKFAARSGLISSGLAKVTGDLERTQGGAANQGRKLAGTLLNLGTTVGSILLPVVTEGITLLNEFGGWAMRTFEENRATVEGWGETLLGVFDYVVAAVHNFPAAFEVARLKIFEAITNIGEWITVLGPNAVSVAEYIGRNWLLLIGDAFDGTVTGLKNLWANFQSVGKAIYEWFADPTQGFHVDWTPLLKGFQATAEKFPELLRPTLTDMSREIAEAARPITDEVAARRARRSMGKGGAAREFTDSPAYDLEKKKKGAGKEKQLAGALELGSKEAYSAVANATSGHTKGMDAIAKSGNETARNTKAIADHFARQNGAKDARPGRLVIS